MHRSVSTWVLVACLGCFHTASAQDATENGEALPPVQAPQGQSASAGNSAPAGNTGDERPDSEEETSDSMNGFGVGIKLGAGILTGQEVATASTSGGTSVGVRKETETTLALGLPIWLGDGHGFATNMEIFHWRQKREFGSGTDVTVAYTGFQAAFGANFQLIDPLYMFVGAGPRFGVVHGDVDAGAHLAVRVPVSLTYYPTSMLGIVTEVGVGYGATAQASVSSSGGSSSFSKGAMIDLTAGVRFP